MSTLQGRDMDRAHKTIAGSRHTITRQHVLAKLVRYDHDYPGNDWPRKEADDAGS